MWTPHEKFEEKFNSIHIRHHTLIRKKLYVIYLGGLVAYVFHTHIG
jgi:hypothetical protein